MSILDDAIREHLELIRRRGATDSEVKRLEDEAFGPPTRPDEADFPQSEEAPAASGAVATEDQLEEPSPEEVLAAEDVTTLLPTEQREEPEEAAAERLANEPVQPEPEGLPPESRESAETAAQQPEPDEPVAEMHPVVEGPAGHQEAPSDEADMPAEEGTSLYDRSQDEEFVDLDLPPDDELRAAEPPSEEHDVTEPEGATPLEPPIESLDTVEHPFPEEIVEGEEPQEEAPPSEEHLVDEEDPAGSAADDAGEEGQQEGEDMLADTPEFLKDAPEDDELWFEQGEPKDFDF